MLKHSPVRAFQHLAIAAPKMSGLLRLLRAFQPPAVTGTGHYPHIARFGLGGLAHRWPLAFKIINRGAQHRWIVPKEAEAGITRTAEITSEFPSTMVMIAREQSPQRRRGLER